MQAELKLKNWNKKDLVMWLRHLVKEFSKADPKKYVKGYKAKLYK